MRKFGRLAAFIATTVGIGIAIGTLNIPGEWYAALHKPVFNPPNWIFAPVWSVIYVLIAVAGWRTWERERRGSGMALWIAQMALNFMWSPVFFSAHRIDLALAVIVALLVTIVGFIIVRWRADRAAALLFLPYALWVSFAALLNASIWLLN